MFAQTNGLTIVGLDGVMVTVEIDIANGLPCFEIVGLPDAAVRESRERVKAAIKNSGYQFPSQRITVNLAPADLKKDSSGLDLPIAIGIMIASGFIAQQSCQKYCFVGELSLEGRIRKVSGILPMAIHCREQGYAGIVVSPDNTQEATLVSGLDIYGPETLHDVVLHLNNEKPLNKAQHLAEQNSAPMEYNEDFADVQGQFAAKRAMEIAAAGGHNIIMVGSPGSGKTMLARRVTSILPPLADQEALEVTKIYSVAGLLPSGGGLITTRPFRSPHHTVSDAGMVGGGRIPRPGEVTLSHHGVLFLDELAEFPRQVLEVLRQPLEDGQITISRVNASLSYPAKSMLIAAMNPCPCGFRLDTKTQCTCSEHDIRRYIKKISGPLLDRIDIHVHVPRLEYSDISSTKASEPSEIIRLRVANARNIQYSRLAKYSLFCNAQMSHKQLKTTCKITAQAQKILQEAFDKMNLSARGYDRIIKVARTIADLEQAEHITENHIAEAIHFRNNVTDMFL